MPANEAKRTHDPNRGRDAAPRRIVCTGVEELAAVASDLIGRCAREAVRERDRFTAALAGGSTPQKTYSALAERGGSAGIDWSRTYLFFGDERLVPQDDPRSNFAMVERTLLRTGQIPRSHVFPAPTDGPDARYAAAAYGRQLAEFFAASPGGAPPRLDLVLLGLGADGHTASLFPGSPALGEQRAWVTWSPAGSLPPPVDRITMTYPILNAARHIVFLAAGEEKAIALRNVFQGDVPVEQCPAAGIRPVDGTITWLVDEPAARWLPQ